MLPVSYPSVVSTLVFSGRLRDMVVVGAPAVAVVATATGFATLGVVLSAFLTADPAFLATVVPNILATRAAIAIGATSLMFFLIPFSYLDLR